MTTRYEQRIRAWSAAVVGGCSVVYAAFPSMLTSQPAQGIAETQSADRVDGDTTWSAITGESSASVASLLGRTARDVWISIGMDEAKAAQLSDDIRIILTAIFTPDFQTYHNHMTSRGLVPDSMANALVDAFVEWDLYSAALPALSPEAGELQRLEYVWNHPHERRVEWRSFRVDSIIAGFGLVSIANSREWPHHGFYTQFSVYAPKHGRLMEAEGHALNRSKDSAWIMFEGRFMSGMQTHIKLNFYYDALTEVWIPLNIVFGTDGDHRPFPLL